MAISHTKQLIDTVQEGVYYLKKIIANIIHDVKSGGPALMMLGLL